MNTEAKINRYTSANKKIGKFDACHYERKQIGKK